VKYHLNRRRRGEEYFIKKMVKLAFESTGMPSIIGK
jgi:hypothetical protein